MESQSSYNNPKLCFYIKMETTKTVPYLKCRDTDEGTRQNPHLLYVTHGWKKASYIFHYKEENLYY